MPAKTPFRAKGRTSQEHFAQLFHKHLDHINYRRMSTDAKALLVDLVRQYKGPKSANNGDLSLEWRKMQACGWRSKRALNNARKELLHFGWIQTTRQGDRRKVSLYALTWIPIDPCDGKLDCQPTFRAANLWELDHEPFVKQKEQPPKPEVRRKALKPVKRAVG